MLKQKFECYCCQQTK